MGRGKIEIKRIESSSNRQVTYSKRKGGLLKKAQEISVLCDAKVSLIIFGGTSGSKMYNYCSPSTTLVQILEEYHKNTSKKLWDPKHENLSNEVDRVKKENADMQIELRHLKGEEINSLNIRELMTLEDGLQNGLDKIRDKQSEYVNTLRQTEEFLDEENKRLTYELQQREYNRQMSLAFRVQPMQPNLQERI
ncbi:hypothetical protein UlMin_035896 [Ulmus minor]